MNDHQHLIAASKRTKNKIKQSILTSSGVSQHRTRAFGEPEIRRATAREDGSPIELIELHHQAENSSCHSLPDGRYNKITETSKYHRNK